MLLQVTQLGEDTVWFQQSRASPSAARLSLIQPQSWFKPQAPLGPAKTAELGAQAGLSLQLRHRACQGL